MRRSLDRSGLRLSVLGIVLALPFSVVPLHQLTPIVADQLPMNLPRMGAVIAVAMVGVASFATWIPARRATGRRSTGRHTRRLDRNQR